MRWFVEKCSGHGLYHRRPLQLQMCLNVGEHFSEITAGDPTTISARTFEDLLGVYPGFCTLREVLLKYLMQVGNIRLKQFYFAFFIPSIGIVWVIVIIRQCP